MTKVLVTGSGQLAWELQRTCPSEIEFIGLSRADLDISRSESVADCMQRIRPDAVINAAAYTAVDKAESDIEAATAANTKGPQYLAEQCGAVGAYFLHISTDFVFDGSSNTPYLADSDKKPLGVYGETKAAGEEAIARSMKEHWAVIRTAWVYSAHGNNFVKTMLRLMDDKPQLGVVGDQIGTPTWARGLAVACWTAVDKKIEGLYHWTDNGVSSWYDFAVAIQRIGIEQGLLKDAIPINSITTEDYPTPARRPLYSVLDKKKILSVLPIKPVHWEEQLRKMMIELAD